MWTSDRLLSGERGRPAEPTPASRGIFAWCDTRGHAHRHLERQWPAGAHGLHHALAEEPRARRGGPAGSEGERRGLPARRLPGSRLSRRRPRREGLERRGGAQPHAGRGGHARAARPRGRRGAPAPRAGGRPRLRHGVLPQRQDARPSRLPPEARLARRATGLPRWRGPGRRVRHRRRLQHRAGRARRLAGRRRRRFDILHGR